jgi:hypothetical protein
VERERVYQALNFISSITQNLCLSQYWNEENAKWHNINFEQFSFNFRDKTLTLCSANAQKTYKVLKTL